MGDERFRPGGGSEQGNIARAHSPRMTASMIVGSEWKFCKAGSELSKTHCFVVHMCLLCLCVCAYLFLLITCDVSHGK